MKCAILFTDIKSSSRLWAAHPDEMLALLTKHENYIRKVAAKYDGFIIKTIGDALMIKFDTLELAISAAIATQTMFAKKPIVFKDSVDQIQIRIGVAFGDVATKSVIVQDHKMKDFFGQTVNLASRMEKEVSRVGGFAVLADHISPKTIELIEKSCEIQRVHFRYICDPKEQPKRSERLIQCRNVADLRLEDHQEHTAFSCTIKN